MSVTGCNDCMQNYKVGTKHYCNPRDVREALSRSKSYSSKLKADLKLERKEHTKTKRYAAKVLAKAYKAMNRHHWEEGPTDNEAKDAIACWFDNTFGFDDGKVAIDRIYGEYNAAGR